MVLRFVVSACVSVTTSVAAVAYWDPSVCVSRLLSVCMSVCRSLVTFSTEQREKRTHQVHGPIHEVVQLRPGSSLLFGRHGY